MKQLVELSGTEYEVTVEQRPRTTTCTVTGVVMGEQVQVKRLGRNSALASWRVAAAQKLKASSAGK